MNVVREFWVCAARRLGYDESWLALLSDQSISIPDIVSKLVAHDPEKATGLFELINCAYFMGVHLASTCTSLEDDLKVFDTAPDLPEDFIRWAITERKGKWSQHFAERTDLSSETYELLYVTDEDGSYNQELFANTAIPESLHALILEENPSVWHTPDRYRSVFYWTYAFCRSSMNVVTG